jgi:sulfoxide reductase heme-binding subunit YedZ
MRDGTGNHLRLSLISFGEPDMLRLKSFLNHTYTFWAALCLPALPMTLSLASGDPEAVQQILHPSGEFAARFMIISMMITPLMMLFKGTS